MINYNLFVVSFLLGSVWQKY